MRPTFGQQAVTAGLSTLAHLSAAGLLLAVAAPPPVVPPKPLPVTVMLMPPGPTTSASAPAAASGPSGAASASDTPPAAAPPAAAEVAPVPPPLLPPVPVALASSRPELKPEPKLKPKMEPKPKPKVEPRPKPTLAVKPPPKPAAPVITPSTRPPKADSAAPILSAQGSMAGPSGMATGTNSGTAQAKAGAGAGFQGTASNGDAVGDNKPTPAYQPKPTYPDFARRLGHEGRVVIRVQVLSSGAVGTASIERSSGYAVLDEAALATIKRWRFRPAQRAGQPVDATLNVPITFKLHESG